MQVSASPLERWLAHAVAEAETLGYAGFAARIVRELPAVAEINRVVVYRLSPDGDRLITVDATPASGEALQNTLMTLSSLPQFLRNAIEAGRQVVMGDMERSNLPDGMRTTMRYKGVRAALYTPYLRDARLAGFFTIELFRLPAEFSDAVKTAAAGAAAVLSMLDPGGDVAGDASLETSAALALLANLSDRVSVGDAKATIAETLADLRMIYRDIGIQTAWRADDPVIAAGLRADGPVVREEMRGTRVVLPMRDESGVHGVLDVQFPSREVPAERMRVLRAVANLLGSTIGAARRRAGRTA